MQQTRPQIKTCLTVETTDNVRVQVVWILLSYCYKLADDDNSSQVG